MRSKSTFVPIVTAFLLSLSVLPTHAQDDGDQLNRTYIVHNLCPSPINLFIAAELQGIIATGATFQELTDVDAGFWYTDANGGRFTGVGTMRAGFFDNTYELIRDQGQINTGIKVAPRAHPNPDGTCTIAECDNASCTDTFVGAIPIFPPNASSPAPFHHCGTGSATNITFDITFCPDGKFPPNSGIEIHPTSDEDKCLEVRGAKFVNGTPVQIDECTGTQAQKWFFTRGSTKLRVAGTDFCLDAGSNPTDGTGLEIRQCVNGLAAQQWNYTVDNHIALQTNGQCVDLTNGTVTNGVQVQTSACVDSDFNQRWDI